MGLDLPSQDAGSKQSLLMKTQTRFSRYFGLSIALGIMVLTLTVQAAQIGSIRVINLHGAARYSNGGSVWMPLSAGMVLKPGAVIQTASESWVDLALANSAANNRPTPIINKGFGAGNMEGDSQGSSQNVVRLRENTLLAIDKLTSEQTGADIVTDTQLDLRAGTIFGYVKKTSAASRYEIKLPNGVAGIRGTLYSISATGVITVYSGSVVVTFFNPENPKETITRAINAGEQYDTNRDTKQMVPAGGMQSATKQASEMSQAAGETYYTAPTQFTADHTEVFVSPVVDQ